MLYPLLAPAPSAGGEADWRALVEAAGYAYEAGRPYQAQELLEKAVELTEPETEPRAAVLNNLAIVLETNGHLHAAEQLYNHVIGLWARIHGPTHVNVSRTLGNLGDLYHRHRRFAEATEAYELAIRTAERADSPEAVDILKALKEGYALLQQHARSEAGESGPADSQDAPSAAD